MEQDIKTIVETRSTVEHLLDNLEDTYNQVWANANKEEIAQWVQDNFDDVNEYEISDDVDECIINLDNYIDDFYDIPFYEPLITDADRSYLATLCDNPTVDNLLLIIDFIKAGIATLHKLVDVALF